MKTVIYTIFVYPMSCWKKWKCNEVKVCIQLKYNYFRSVWIKFPHYEAINEMWSQILESPFFWYNNQYSNSCCSWCVKQKSVIVWVVYHVHPPRCKTPVITFSCLLSMCCLSTVGLTKPNYDGNIWLGPTYNMVCKVRAPII